MTITINDSRIVGGGFGWFDAPDVDGKTAVPTVEAVYTQVPCSNTIPALSKLTSTGIARPYQCFVLGCDESILRDGTGTALVVAHKRFGSVHTCDGHNPKGRDRF